MIKVDIDKTEISGDVTVVTGEIASLFKSLNLFFDQNGEYKELIEETCMCNETAYRQMQILMIRLDKAHERALKTKKKYNLDF